MFVTLLKVSVGYNVKVTILISNTGANFLGDPGLSFSSVGVSVLVCRQSDEMG